MSYLSNKTFWIRTLERAVKTFLQAFIAVFAAGNVFNVFDADWVKALGIALGATLLSVLTSIGSGSIGEKNDPSLVNHGKDAPQPAPQA